jgi:hypothetical protein
VFHSSSVASYRDRFDGNVASTAVSAWGYGGGVALRESSFTVDNASVWDNRASAFGGGFYVEDASELVLRGSELTENRAGMGGGFYLSSSPHGYFSGNTITGNWAEYGGGGTLMSSGDTRIEANHISGNASAGLAGGLWLAGADGTDVSRNWLTGNRAANGGGVMVLEAEDVQMTNNVIADNMAEIGQEGAGVLVSGSSAVLTHNTLASNAGGDGSGVHVADGSVVTTTNTIAVDHLVAITVATGSTVNVVGTLWGEGDWANGLDLGGGGAITASGPHVFAQPGFRDAAIGDYHLTPGSAAVDAGVDAGVVDDIDGGARPWGVGPDLGADEVVAVFLPLVLRN